MGFVVVAYRRRAARVVYNILLDAYEAVEEGGEVAVTCRDLPETSPVCLVIEDTGAGFSEAYLGNCLFCAFRSTNRPVEGWASTAPERPLLHETTRPVHEIQLSR
jgi:C4-dicarboxylate-specific signal transduction histidine kinase